MEIFSFQYQVRVVELDEGKGQFVMKAEVEHPYPATKIMWIPDAVRDGDRT